MQKSKVTSIRERKGLTWQLVDARYAASVQQLAGRVPRYGRQVWISSNWPAGQLIERMGRVNAEPILRRLLDIADIWKG